MSELSGDNVLKKYNPKLYQRRMNNLTQIGIIAADLVLLDKSIEKMGLVFGTPFGSMSSAEHYMKSIIDDGFDKASGIYFQDLVLNSTAGRICKAFSLKDYSVSLSSGGNEDLKALEIAFDAIKNEKCDNLIVGSGHERSEAVDKLTSNNFLSCSSFASLSCTPEVDSLLIRNVRSFTFNDTHDLIKKLYDFIKDNDKIYLQDYGKEVRSIDIGNDQIIYEESHDFSSGSFKKLIEIKNTSKQFALVGLSLTNEAVIVEISKN